MSIRIYRPTSPARRQTSVLDFSGLTKKRPEKSLISTKKIQAGRNVSGKITVRHQGGGVKTFIRLVDFKQDKFNIVGRVAAIEYDPNRSAFIALVNYADGEKRYHLAPQDLKVGDKIVSSLQPLEIKVGNRTVLKNIPVGLFVHNIELEPRKGGKLVRSAGLGAQLQALENGFVTLKIPSGEIRMVSENCLATIGMVSNSDWQNIRWGKAGRLRRKGIRPSVRGKAMNPVDHPHGGGEGVNPIGLKYPKTLWGKHALGVKTRKQNKKSDKLIIRRKK
ncbi:MAG: 50S ribosomal protein L2 [Candidatus Buchananbacteria bacterium]